MCGTDVALTSCYISVIIYSKLLETKPRITLLLSELQWTGLQDILQKTQPAENQDQRLWVLT